MKQTTEQSESVNFGAAAPSIFSRIFTFLIRYWQRYPLGVFSVLLILALTVIYNNYMISRGALHGCGGVMRETVRRELSVRAYLIFFSNKSLRIRFRFGEKPTGVFDLLKMIWDSKMICKKYFDEQNIFLI